MIDPATRPGFTPRRWPAAAADADCESCHRAHAGLDNVWVQVYPTLRKLI
jgi:hypothetical protein